MGRLLLLAVMGIVAAYLALVVWVYFCQRSLQYFPSFRDSEGRGGDVLQPWRDASGGFLGYVRPAPGAREAILFFHGNGGEALDRAWLDKLVPRDVLFFVAEYPGYGAKPGKTTEEAIFHDAEIAYDEAHRAGKLPLSVMGESLGSGVAVYVASRRPVTRVALISPFSSALDVAKSAYPYLPVQFLMQDRFLSTEYLKKVDVPLHVVHGDADEIIPLALAKKLMDDYRGPKTLTVLKDVGHNDISGPLVTDPKAANFRRFLSGN